MFLWRLLLCVLNFSNNKPPRLGPVQCIPLPSDLHPLPSPVPALFPLILTLSLHPETASRLSSLAISANSIHIHDTTAHIGDISTPGGVYSALDIVDFVRDLVHQDISLSTYDPLSIRLKERVELSFKNRYLRQGRGVSANRAWATFLDGQQRMTGPKGVDLVLGRPARPITIQKRSTRTQPDIALAPCSARYFTVIHGTSR